MYGKRKGSGSHNFMLPWLELLGRVYFETFFSNFEMVKKVGCDLCMLKITKTHDFVAKNFEIKKKKFRIFVMKSTMVSVRGRARPQRMV